MRRRRTLVETRTRRHARSFDGARSSYRRGDGGGGGGRRAPRDNLLARAPRDRTDDVRRDGGVEPYTPARVTARTLEIELAREARTRVRRDVRRGVQDHRVRKSRESRRDAVRSVRSERRRVGGRVRHRRRDRIRDDGSNAPRGGSDETRARANGVVEVARLVVRWRLGPARTRLARARIGVREGATANDSPTESKLPARTRIHRAVRRGARVRGVVDSGRRAASSRRFSSASSTATRRHPPPPPRSLHSASAMDKVASANEPCVRTANAAENAARARRTRARLVAARHVLVASRSLARSRRDARSFDARADARRRVQTRRDARSVATGRSRIRNDVGVASMTRCAEVTGVDVASTAAVVLGCPGWIVRGAYPACGSPRRPHPACGSPRRPRSACGSPRRPRSACGSPRRRDGAGAIFPSMDETTPRPSPIGEGRVRAARRASSSEKASRDAGRGGRGRTRAEACATTSPVGNAKKCREAIACVGEGGGWDAWTPQGLVARGRGVSDKTGISIPRGRGRSRRARGRTRGLARSRRGISRESSSARDRVSANMSSARAAFAGQRASDREPDRVPLGVFFCFRRCRDARATKMCQACANSSPRGRFDEKRSIWGI